MEVANPEAFVRRHQGRRRVRRAGPGGSLRPRRSQSASRSTTGPGSTPRCRSRRPVRLRQDAGWFGTLPKHHYRLYFSQDNGSTFSRRSVLPVDLGRGYGTMAILPDGSLIVYVYNTDDEKNLDYVISQDGGLTWSVVQTAFMA